MESQNYQADCYEEAECNTESCVLYNTIPTYSTSCFTGPANAIYFYEIRLKGIDAVSSLKSTIKHNIDVGDVVWVKLPQSHVLPNL